MDEALTLLQQAIDHGLSPAGIAGIDKDPDLNPLHSDHCFVALVALAKQHPASPQP
jgi:hypothetical protein